EAGQRTQATPHRGPTQRRPCAGGQSCAWPTGPRSRWDARTGGEPRWGGGRVVARCAGRRRPSAGHPDRPQPGPPPSAPRRGSLAPPPFGGAAHGQGGQGLRPKRTAVVACPTDPPEGATTLCLDELGPVVPRTFAPAPGWSRTGHRIKAPLDSLRGNQKVWVYGALRVRDGHELPFTAPSRHTAGY